MPRTFHQREPVKGDHNIDVSGMLQRIEELEKKDEDVKNPNTSPVAPNAKALFGSEVNDHENEKLSSGFQ